MLSIYQRIGKNGEENVPRPYGAFPLFICYEDMSTYDGDCVPWHWHFDVELIYVLRGKMLLRTNNHSFVLQADEGIFINSNMLHYKETVDKAPPIALDLVFDPLLVSGSRKSAIDQKYVAPVLECKNLEAYALRPDKPGSNLVLQLIRKIYQSALDQAEGYEFEVRNLLSSAWYALYQELGELMKERRITPNLSEERIKKMLIFIQGNYAEKLSLEQIAAAADISSRECLRCFQQSLGMTPFTYLLEFRVREAAAMLRSTDRNITEIAYACGFSGTSYFTRTFRKFIGCTPSKYREEHSDLP